MFFHSVSFFEMSAPKKGAFKLYRIIIPHNKHINHFKHFYNFSTKNAFKAKISVKKLLGKG